MVPAAEHLWSSGEAKLPANGYDSGRKRPDREKHGITGLQRSISVNYPKPQWLKLTVVITTQGFCGSALQTGPGVVCTLMWGLQLD